jgi:hypothetical protein
VAQGAQLLGPSSALTCGRGVHRCRRFVGSNAAPHQLIRSTLMRYLIAWLLGVPISVLLLWYVFSHLL